MIIQLSASMFGLFLFVKSRCFIFLVQFFINLPRAFTQGQPVLPTIECRYSTILNEYGKWIERNSVFSGRYSFGFSSKENCVSAAVNHDTIYGNA